MKISDAPRAFVVGPYLPHGGALMAYHIGRILQLDFNFQVVAVRMEKETPLAGVFQYDPAFPSVPLAEMEATIREDDVPPAMAQRCRSSHTARALWVRRWPSAWLPT